MIELEGMNIPIKSWCLSLESSALEQALNLSKLTFAFKHICLMPDAHMGYGMPVGGVMALKNAIIPNAVGVDIGCGMCAVKTDIKSLNIDQLKQILQYIRKNVPVGFSHHQKAQEWSEFDNAPDLPVIKKELNSATKQLGTLGGGNHFIEIQQGDDGFIWMMVHSGSRNFGYKIAKEYNDIAKNLCVLWHSNIPEIKGHDGLAFLPIDTQEAQEYIAGMNYALSFAYENRLRMIEKCKKAFEEILSINFEDVINIHHNYAALENHFGKNVWVHRKGATSARKNEIGIIPGSQGTASYIVKGKGNIDSFMSCSHGAGRAMGRKKAIETLNLKKEQDILDKKGILHALRNKEDLDEASSAYKDISIVMNEQKDLVDIVTKLQPLAVIKG